MGIIALAQTFNLRLVLARVKNARKSNVLTASRLHK